MRKQLLTLFTFSIIFLFSTQSNAQGYVKFSTYSGGSGVDSVETSVVVNGETYVLASTTSANYPVTNGSTYKGGVDAVITKYDINGNVVYSTYLGGSGDEDLFQLKVLNGEVFISGITTSPNYPVTNGSVYKGDEDVVVTKLSTSGSIIFGGYYGGDGYDDVGYSPMQIVNNELYIYGTTNSANFPVVNGTPNNASGYDGSFLMTLKTTDCSTIFSTCLNGSSGAESYYLQVDSTNGQAYISGTTTSTDLPVTNSSINKGSDDIFVASYTSSGIRTLVTYLGGTNDDDVFDMQIVNGSIYLAGTTNSWDFPVTDGGTDSSYNVAYIAKLTSTGNISFAKYIGDQTSTGYDLPEQLQIINNAIYVLNTNADGTNNASYSDVIKLDTTGNVLYLTTLNGTNFITPDGNDNSINSMVVIGGEVYLNGVLNGTGYPITNGSTFYSGGTGYFTKLGTSGNIIFSEYLGKMSNLSMLQVMNNKLYMVGTTAASTYPSTNGTHFSGGQDNIVLAMNTDGSTNFAAYYGGTNDESLLYDYGYAAYSSLRVDNNYIYLLGQTKSVDYPVTNTSIYKNNSDIFFTKIKLCPFDYDVTFDTLSPIVQTTCKQGLGQLITGKSILIVPTEAPALTRNGVTTPQPNIEATYQWQVANSPAGPWTTTPGTTKNYLPTGGNVNQYYRRLSFTLANCGNPAVDTSNVASVLVNSNTAPVVNAGGNFYTCPGSAVTIGGAPTLSGGTTPYTLSWDMGAGTSANPVVSPAVSTIYTASVTDALGCKQIGQTVVITYKANAGIDKNDCASTPVQIGGTPMSGLPGVLYSWTNAASLSNGTIAQPLANPTITTTYTLTVTLPKTGGGTCTTTDDVIITPVNSPAANFAGPDQVICLGDSVTLGGAPDAGFSYSWSPQDYLKRSNRSTATFYAGTQWAQMPTPNPITYYLTATKGTCYFVDQTTVAAIEASQQVNLCGPTTLGTLDRTPNINETYTWTKDGGPSNFVGPSNGPQINVSESIGGSTVYTEEVTYNGHTCSVQDTVVDCNLGAGSGCSLNIYVQSKYGCPDYTLNNGAVTLYAYSNVANASYSWSPTVGISNNTGSSVQLTDDIARTYTVTVTSLNDPSYNCSTTIPVNNNPASILPSFIAADVTTCVNQPVTIGDPVGGYFYQWQGFGLSDNFISNPVATLASSNSYPVQITDASTGCSIYDTVAVTVENVVADAGPDQTICTSAIVKLGTPALPNTAYSWSPSACPWQNSTNQFSAQPQVLVAADETFTLMATSPFGCTDFSSVDIVLNSIPTVADAPDTTVCIGTGGLIGSPALPGVTYLWSPSTGLNDPTVAQPIATPATSTNYTVVATFPGLCPFPATDQVLVNVTDLSFTMPNITFCPSDGAVSLGSSAPAGMNNYSWSPSNLVSDSTIDNPATLDPPPTSTTTFTLNIEDGSGCTGSGTVTIIPGQVAPIAGTERAICNSTSTTLGSAANITGANIIYQWDPVTYLDNSSSIQPVFSAVDTGTFTYVVTKTDVVLGCSSTDTVIVTVNGVNLSVAGSLTICQNSCKEIGDTTTIPGVQYVWSPSTGLSDPSIANPIACVGTSNTLYSLVATGTNGCTATANVLVAVYPSPAPQVTIPTVLACNGATNVTFNPLITPVGSYNYVWSPDDASLNNIYIATPQIYITGNGTKQYTLTVTNTSTGCSSSATGIVTTSTCATLGQIGDYVWYDTNQDGVQNINEFGASGVTVTAYNSLGSVLAVAITDITGHYSLKNIQPGTGYYIIVKNPSGYIFTPSNVGGSLAINNSKVDAAGKSNSFSIAAGDTLSNIDAGIIPIGTPLAITLVSFSGELSNNNIILNWQTSAEYQNHYFIIEKSTDGINYNRIGTVNGHGTTTIAHDYTFTDAQPADGHNFYRLIEVDYSGNNVYSSIVDVTDNIHQSLTAVYLPEQHDILVTFDKIQNGNVWFNLFADNGQLMSATSVENIISQKINVGTLASGVYMLQVINSTNNYTKKIFINK
jgi:hypothetical protein